VRAISRLGIEDAIATIEDEIARVRPRAAETLETSDTHILTLAAGLNPLSIEAVEQDFQRLASRGIPTDRDAAATLVILRELIHHLQVKAIRFV
jgi:hypothetical protein